MSSIVSSTPLSAEQLKVRQGRPNFFGLVGAEFYKAARMSSTWIMLILFLCTIGLAFVFAFTNTGIKDALIHQPVPTLYQEMSVVLTVVRVFIGFFLIILTATVVGREYQLGTIRILLARGVGRLQLLLAKVLMLVVSGLLVLILGLALSLGLTVLLLLVKTGNFAALNTAGSAYWSNAWLYVLTILVSMGATLLMTLAVTVLGRSLAFGMAVGLAWFPADNIGTLFMALGYRLTKNDFWRQITAYFLGPNLNQMPVVTLPASTNVQNYGALPYVKVDSTHTLLIALAYSLVFAIVAVVLTWKRDVKE